MVSRSTLSTAIGRKILAIRQRRGLTLSELARMAGISKSTLSEIEAGKVNPTIGTLWAIAKALGVSFGELVEPLQELCAEDVCVQLLKRGVNTELYLMHVRRGVTYVAQAHPEGTREHITILKGRLLCGPLDRPVLLEAGGSVTFLADRAHIYAAFDEDVTCLVLVKYRPLFAMANSVLDLEIIDEGSAIRRLEELVVQVQHGLSSCHVLLLGTEERAINTILKHLRTQRTPRVKIVYIEREPHKYSIFLFRRDPFENIEWLIPDIIETSEKARQCVCLLREFAYSVPNRNYISKLAESSENFILSLLASEYLAFLGEPRVPAYIQHMYKLFANYIEEVQDYLFEKNIDSRLFAIFGPLRPGYTRQILLTTYYVVKNSKSCNNYNLLSISVDPGHHVRLILELVPRTHVHRLRIVNLCISYALANCARRILNEYDNVDVMYEDVLVYEPYHKFDTILCFNALPYLDTWKLLSKCHELLREDGLLIVADSFLPDFDSWRSRVRALLLNHLAYAVDSIVELSEETLSDAERRLVSLVKACCVDTLHEVLSRRLTRGLSQFLRYYKSIEELVSRVELNKLSNLAIGYFLACYLELARLKLGLAFKYREITVHNFAKLAERTGFELVAMHRVYPTYGNGGTYVIVLRRV